MFKFFTVLTSTTVLSIVSSQPLNKCLQKCPKPNNPFAIPTLVPHRDCTKYCYCDDGCPTVKTCPENFHFSLDELMCLPVELAKCADRNDCIGTCPIVYNTQNVLLLPHHNSSKYCHCRELGVPTVETCPESLVFNIKFAQCQKPPKDCNNEDDVEEPKVDRSDVKSSSTTEASTSVPFEIEDSPTKSSDFGDSIIVITNEEPTSTLAPESDDERTELSKEDDEATIATSSNDSTIVASNSEDLKTIVSNPEDSATTEASKIDESSTVSSSKDSEVNVVPNSENSMTEASNKDSSSTVASTENDSTTSTIASTSESTSEAKTTVTSKVDDSTTAAPLNATKISIVPCNCIETIYIYRHPPADINDCIGQCPLENDAYYTVHLPHKNCQQYCKCDWGNATVMDCPYNLHFNSELEVCDYPSNAKCTGIGAIRTV